MEAAAENQMWSMSILASCAQTVHRLFILEKPPEIYTQGGGSIPGTSRKKKVSHLCTNTKQRDTVELNQNSKLRLYIASKTAFLDRLLKESASEGARQNY